MKCRVFDPLNELLTGATGVMGGSFDPVQTAHIEKALAVRKILNLDEVILIPAGVSPFKPNGPIATNHERLEMLKIIIKKLNGLSVDDVELKREGTSFTLPTMQLLGAPERDLVMILGMDAFHTIQTWFNWKELLRTVHTVVVPRSGKSFGDLGSNTPDFPWEIEYKSDVGWAWVNDSGKYLVFLDLPKSDVSSTEVRRRIAKCQSYTTLVPPGVEDYIRALGLYQENEGL